MEPVQVCKRCILDSSVPGVSFDAWGICNHCRLHDRLEQRYALNAANRTAFEQMLNDIRARGKGSRYDCIVGLSGGVDSTYCLYMTKKLGLRPLALHYDNGWVTDVARRNIERAVQALGVDLKIVTTPWEDIRNYHRACLRASIPETCLPCEIGIVSSLYDAADQENIRYIILGTSFRTEGINPLRWHYVDGAYFNDIMRTCGARDAKARRFNKITAPSLFKYIVVKKIKSIQLPLYMDYQNRRIMPILEKELGWQYGGGVHFDCAYKPFGTFIDNEKFNRHPKKVALAALVRTQELSREEALEEARRDAEGPPHRPGVEYCMQRLGITPEELATIVAAAPKTFLNYRTYYSIFSFFRLPIRIACTIKLVPETLYEKLFTVV